MGAARTLIDASWTITQAFAELAGGKDQATEWIIKNADHLALLAPERGLEPPTLAKVLAERKKSAGTCSKLFAERFRSSNGTPPTKPRLRASPWPPPDAPKDNGEW